MGSDHFDVFFERPKIELKPGQIQAFVVFAWLGEPAPHKAGEFGTKAQRSRETLAKSNSTLVNGPAVHLVASFTWPSAHLATHAPLLHLDGHRTGPSGLVPLDLTESLKTKIYMNQWTTKLRCNAWRRTILKYEVE